jgi:hypothetical protein
MLKTLILALVFSLSLEAVPPRSRPPELPPVQYVTVSTQIGPTIYVDGFPFEQEFEIQYQQILPDGAVRVLQEYFYIVIYM